MQVIKIKTYKFDELSDEAKAKAIEAERNNEYGITYGAWYDSVEWDWKDKLNKLGFNNVEIFFSGFWSQGDGACFTADVDTAKWLKAHKLANKMRALYSNAELWTFSISHVGRYYHENSMVVEEQFWNDTPNFKAEAQQDKMLHLLEAEVVELAKQLYKDLEAEYENLTSDDVIADYLTTNEYDFLENGSQHYQV